MPAVFCGTKKPVAKLIPLADEHPNCPTWARTGECDRNRDFMRIHCQKSCKEVADTGGKDTDYDPNCPGWAKHGHCKKAAGYMLVNCKKSCKAVGAM